MIREGPREDRPTLALVGASGAVGSVVLRILSQRADVWGEIRLVASPRSAGRELSVRGESVAVRELDAEVFEGVDVAVFDVPDAVAEQWAPVAAERGAVVVDNSAAFRGHPEVPLVAPQVNPAQARTRPLGIVANPSGATLTMIDALGPLHHGWQLTDLVVATYQAASGAGQAGIQQLQDELEVVAGRRGLGRLTGDVRLAVRDKLGDDSPFPAPLALNVIPWVGVEGDGGWTSDEEAIREEARRILGAPALPVRATCVQVPVTTGHSVAVHATFDRAITVEEARQALVEAPSVVVLDDPDLHEFPTPVDAAGSDPAFVGRVRQAPGSPHTLELFVCADNLRQGCALNAVRIAELLANDLPEAG